VRVEGNATDASRNASLHKYRRRPGSGAPPELAEMLRASAGGGQTC
jgi:hypothetical protein